MDYQVVKVKEDILVENDKKAREVREKLGNKGIYFINVMASPGSGKTTLLVNLINRLKSKYKIGVMVLGLISIQDGIDLISSS